MAGDGNDTFFSSLGNDEFFGGSGINTINYGNMIQSAYIDLQDNIVIVGSKIDSIY